MKRTIVFILSTNYAGSHYLSLLLGSNSHAIHAGEILRFKNPHVRKQPCSICGDFKRCPVFQGIEPGNVNTIHETIFANAGPNVELLIDNSKKAEWASLFLNNPKFAKKFIHLIRDPRALVRRWALSYNTPAKALRQRIRVARKWPGRRTAILLAKQRMVYLSKWLLQNQEITDFLKRNQLESHLLTYHDLARNTVSELEHIHDWLGLKFESQQLEYWNFEHHGSQKAEYEWVKQGKTSYFDTRWKEFLTETEQRAIASDPLVNRYLKSLGLRIAQDGLTRSSVNLEPV